MSGRNLVGCFERIAACGLLSLAAIVSTGVSPTVADEVLTTVGQWKVIRGTGGLGGRCVLQKQEASGSYEISRSGSSAEPFLVRGSVGPMLQALNALVGSSQRVQATMQYDGAREQRLVKLSGDEFSFAESEQLRKAIGFKVSLMLVPKSAATNAITESHTGMVVDYSLIRFGEVAPWLEKPECRS